MMKKLSIYAMLAVVMSACNMLAEVETDTLELLNKANEEMVFLASGGEKTVVLVTDSDWTAESDAQWCKVSPEEGTAESAKIKMTVEANDKAEEREATITVSIAAKSLQMKVIQREKKSILLEEADFVIDAEGDVFEVELKHNVEYEVEFSDRVSWIREVKSKKMSKATHEFEVEPNDSPDERSVEIIFICEDEDIEEVVSVVQKGVEKDSGKEEEEKYFIFSVTASGTDFVMPYISGGFTGYVYWGDGTSSPFSSDLEGYRYDNDTEHTVEMKLSGSSEDFVVEFKDIKGLVKVDLSNM